MIRSRLRKERTEAEAGISLTELIVAMLIFGIASTMIIGFFVSTTRTMSLAQSLNTNTKQASNGMNQTARLIRAGTENPIPNNNTNDPAFVEAMPERLTMYAYVNLQSSEQTPVMVQLSLNAQRQLIEKQWAANDIGNGYWSFPAVTASPLSTRILASSVAPVGTMFTYLKADGTALPSTGTHSADVRRSIAAVKVTLTLQEAGLGAEHRVTLENTVGIPNLGFHRVVS